MGRRGPKPQPASVKAAKGNPGRRPLGKDPEAAIEAAKPGVSPPSWLEGPGLDIWQHLAPNLVALKLLTQTDAFAFARYCRSLARWLELSKRIDEEGLTVHVVSKHGEWDRPHPLLMACDRLEVRLQAFEDRFGLNPAERQRIFAARAAQPRAGDLFAAEAAPRSDKTDVPAAPSTSPVGLLN